MATSKYTPRRKTAESILHLALMMQRPGGVSLREIQETFGKQRRSAERMRDALRDAMDDFSPASTESFWDYDEADNRIKKWRIRGTSMNSISGIKPEELAHLETAIKMFRRDGLKEQAQSLEVLSHKIAGAIPNREALTLEREIEILADAEGLVNRPGPRQKVPVDVLSELQYAIRANAVISFQYQNAENSPRRRHTACPYGFLYGGQNYLVAAGHKNRINGYRDFKLYALARIENISTTNEMFQPNDAYPISGYAQKSFGVYQEPPIDVVWKFRPNAKFADPRHYEFHPSQATEDLEDGSFVVRFRAGGIWEMCWHLFQWGDDVEILEPKSLRKAYKTFLNVSIKHLS